MSLMGSSILIVAFFIGLLVICGVIKILSLPLAILWKCIYNSIIGAIVLYVINWIGLVYIPIKFFTALIAGIFGIPGVVALAIWYML